jgi:hypothetical protein
MGKAWDGTGIAFRREMWEAAYRVAKPSAYLLAFGGTRTVHRMTVALEDAGWIIRDMLVWGYASGFPKSKASLKPAWEPIVMARKPGPLRMLAIDACRIPSDDGFEKAWDKPVSVNAKNIMVGTLSGSTERKTVDISANKPVGGRWPANIVLTATEWYTLRDDVDQSARSLIADYFEAQGVGVDPVPAVRRVVRGDAGMGAGRTPEVLLEAVPGAGDGSGEAQGDPAHRGVASADEGREDGALSGAGVARLEGRQVPRPERLRVGGGLDPDGTGAGTSRGDGSEDGEGSPLRPGAPAGDGDDAGPPTATVRGSASPQRGEGRQQPEQPVPQGSVEPHPRASDGRPGAGTTARTSRRARSGERRVTVPRDLIPAGWLRYFRFSHDTGIFDGGVAGVVGGGRASDSPSDVTRPNRTTTHSNIYGGDTGMPVPDEVWGYGDSGTYSRFFLIPKADRADREPVLGGLPETLTVQTVALGEMEYATYPDGRRREAKPKPRSNVHPTVKPTDLMRHLLRLVTPTGGIVLDPFGGSGSTAIAAEKEGFDWILIERELEYVKIAEARLNGTQRGLGLEAS